MRILLTSLAIVITFFFMNCKNVTPETYVGSGTIEQPTVEQRDSTIKAREEEERIITQLPEKTQSKIEVAKKEREEQSIYRDQGCCIEYTDSLCCCEPVFENYKAMFDSKNVADIGRIRSQDPLLNNCYKLYPAIKRKLDMLEMGDEEE